MPREEFDRPPPVSDEEGDDGLLRLLKEVVAEENEERAREELRKRKRAEKEVAKELEEEDHLRRKFKITSLSGIRPKPVYWLWRNRIPLGEITMVAGRGGIGKSLFLCTLVAWITTGECKGEFWGVPRNVIFQANEDSYEKTVVPRLLAAGADMSRVYRLDVELDGEAHSLMLPRDLDEVGRMADEIKAAALFVDPLSSNMTDKDRNAPEVRRSYERLRTFAEKADLAVIGNGHTRKGQSADLLEALMGSSEIGNVIRAAIGVIKDPDSEDHQVILSQCKNNLGPANLKSYTYRIVPRAYEDGTGLTLEAPVLDWGQSTDRHVNDIFSEPLHQDSQSDLAECKEWLRDYLRMNPGVARKTAMAEGRKFGHKEHTIKRAARAVADSATVPGRFPREVAWYVKGDSRDSGNSGDNSTNNGDD